MSGTRRAAALLAAAALLTLSPTLASARATTTRAGLVMDDAHVLDVSRVVHDVNAVHDGSGTHVAVLTTNDPEVSKDDYDDDVMTWLRAHAPDAVLDADREDLHDGLILVAISPDVRQVGVYAADDVGLDADDVEEVVDVMRPAAKAKDWDRAAVRGATKALAVTSAADTADPDPVDPGGEPFPDPDDPTASDAGASRAGPVLLGVAAAAGLVAAPFVAVSMHRRRKVRRAWLAWEPEPGAAAEAARRWRDAVETVQVVGYPGRPFDSTVGRVDPAAAVETLERVARSGLTTEQRAFVKERAQLRALLDPDAMLAAWVADAHYWAREPGWDQRWSHEHDELLAAPLTALTRSVADLTERLPRANLRATGQRVAQLADAAGRLDEQVRSEQRRPTDGEAEARRLNRAIRQLARETAERLAPGLSAADRRRLVSSDAGSDPGLRPYLLDGLIAASTPPPSATGFAGTSGPGDPSWSATTTFTDSSGGGSGTTGGSGGF